MFLPHSVVFQYQALWQYSDEDPFNGSAKCRCGRQKLKFSTNIWLHRVLSTVRPPSVIHTAAPDCGKLMTLIIGSNKRRRLSFLGDGRRSVYNKKPQRYAEDDRPEFNCTHRRIDKSEAAITNNKRLRSRHRTIEANYWQWQIQSIARPLCSSRASCWSCVIDKGGYPSVLSACLHRFLSYKSFIWTCLVSAGQNMRTINLRTEKPPDWGYLGYSKL